MQELDPKGKFEGQSSIWHWEASLNGASVDFSECCTSSGFSPQCKCSPRSNCQSAHWRSQVNLVPWHQAVHCLQKTYAYSAYVIRYHDGWIFINIAVYLEASISAVVLAYWGPAYDCWHIYFPSTSSFFPMVYNHLDPATNSSSQLHKQILQRCES